MHKNTIGLHSTMPLKHKNNPVLMIAVLLLCVATSGVFVSDMYLPSLPSIANSFNVSVHVVQMTIAVYLLAMSAAQLFYGPMSDRFGRKSMVCLGLFVALMGSLIGLWAQQMYWLVIGRAMQGVGMGATSSLFRAILRDTFSGKKLTKVIAWSATAFSLAPAIAPVIGGYTDFYFGWRGTFLVLTGYILFSLIMVVWLIPETNVNRHHCLVWRRVWLDYYELIRHRVFLSNALCTGAVMCGLFAYLTISPFLFQTVIGLNSVQYGWTAVLLIIASVAGKLVNIRLVNFLDGWQLIIVGLVFMLIAGGGLLTVSLFHWLNLWSVLIPCMFYIFAGGLVFTNSASNALNPFPHKAGTAGALYGFIQLTGAFIGSTVMTMWHASSSMPLAVLFSCLAILTCVQYYWLVIQPKILSSTHSRL